MTWAQQGSGRERPSDRNRRPAGEAVTVSGSLIVAHGSPAVKSGDDIYFVRGINRLVGFVDGLKEGAQVTIEGVSFTNPRDTKLKFLRPAKLTFNGKAYDLEPPAFGMHRPFGAHRQFAPYPDNPRPFGTPPPSNRHQGPHAPQWKQHQHQWQHIEPREFRR